GASPPSNRTKSAVAGAPALLFQLPDLVHSPGMPAAGKLGGEKRVGDLQGEAGTDNARAKAQDVGVVMLPGHPGRKGLRAQGSPHARDLVRGDGHADAGAANQDPPVIL